LAPASQLPNHGGKMQHSRCLARFVEHPKQTRDRSNKIPLQ
jgi:hypothetical protein